MVNVRKFHLSIAMEGKPSAPLLFNRPTYAVAGFAGNPLEIDGTAQPLLGYFQARRSSKAKP
jgi:hypothetical protein